jgi:hypothetical protein
MSNTFISFVKRAWANSTSHRETSCGGFDIMSPVAVEVVPDTHVQRPPRQM